jgi:hypothetical protein
MHPTAWPRKWSVLNGHAIDVNNGKMTARKPTLRDLETTLYLLADGLLDHPRVNIWIVD